MNAELADYIWYLSAVQGVKELLPEIDSQYAPFLASDYPSGQLVQDQGEYIQGAGAFGANYTEAWQHIMSS